MTEHQDSLWAALAKAVAWMLALIGSIQLAQVQAVLGIIATSLVIVGSALNIFIVLKKRAWKQPSDKES